MYRNYIERMRDKDLEEELARFVKRKNVKEEFSQRLTESSRRSFLRLRFRTDGRSITTEQLERVSRELQLFWNLPPSLPPKFGGFNYSAMRFPRINWQKGNETMPVSKPTLGQAVERWSLEIYTADYSHWQMLQDLPHTSSHVTLVHVKDLDTGGVSVQIDGFDHEQGLKIYNQCSALGMLCTLVRHADTEVRLEHSVGFNLQQRPKETKVNTNPIAITTKTLINDRDVTTYSDSELYDLIRKEEAKIEELGKIKAKPKKLVAEIERRQNGIKQLVELLDSREGAKSDS